MSNKEIHYEGWLIKSPPSKRIWRARWRRRWFTLKQGEIPEQFCLEYYTDRNCRKLKGVIDLDQCEQVDCGLRLENRKQKFQFMFDIKTPKRTYYLAADTEADMRDWVNCICQVCHLHDTKQSNDLQDENRTQHTTTSATALSNSTNNTTTTSLHSSSATTTSNNNSISGLPPAAATTTAIRSVSSNDILRRTAVVIDQQPHAQTFSPMHHNQYNQQQHNINTDSVYVNTDYTNRETMLCDAHFDQQQLLAAAQHQPPPSPGTALYLNSAFLQTAAAQAAADHARQTVNSNGIVRKIPENLVLNNTPLPDADTQQHSVQPSPALSTASGPYIPISECFSGSPKFLLDGNNPTTPLNNLDPKFYDTPRSHNNIGLNLTNDQSYSPKITNCSLQQVANAKNRSHRSDSDSESVFTDDDEWTHPLPLRENVDRSTRPSDSSIENESFVLTYSQRFSKLPDEGVCKDPKSLPNNETTADGVQNPLQKLAKVLKNKNNLILDFKEHEKLQRDFPQLSDTENTSPTIGPRNANSVVEESYDIPRSHQLPYYNMGQLLEKVISPHTNPIAASTPNLMAAMETGAAVGATTSVGAVASAISGGNGSGANSPAHVRTLPRPHFYTNAAPSKVEGNVFRYDFIEQTDLPPVNRKLKPKVNIEDKPPEELPAKPPNAVDNLTNKMLSTNLQSPGAVGGASSESPPPLKPPSVDRKCKPKLYGSSATMSPATRRSSGAPLFMSSPIYDNERGASGGGYIMETRTLPRQRTNFAATGTVVSSNIGSTANAIQYQHQRTASAAAAMQLTTATMPTSTTQPLPLPQKQNEHKLQYFDLDVTNKPSAIVNRQSIGSSNSTAVAAGALRLGHHAAETKTTRAPIQQSGVVYNLVDFVKTEAFQRIREERKKESECVNNANK